MSNLDSNSNTVPPVVDLYRVARDLAEALVPLLHGRAALDLRVARLLGWIKGQDLSTRGYSRFANFCRAHVDWGDTWLNGLIRLVTSGLDQVQAAACAGTLPLTVAVDAPSHLGPAEKLEPGDQEAWIAAAHAGTIERRKRGKAEERRTIKTVDVEGAVLRHITAARQLARLVTGQALSDAAADRFILHHWSVGTRGEVILAKALEPPPKPAPLPPAFAGNDLAVDLVGPWVEPVSLVNAEGKLAQVLAIRRERYVRIGRLFAQLKADKLYRALDHGSLGSLARSFGISLRTLERACALADTLDTHPILEQRGLSIDQVEAIGEVATEETVEAWAFVAHYTGVGELVRAVKMATSVPGVLGMYIEAARIAGVATYAPAAHPPRCPPGTIPVRATKTVALAASLRPPPCPRHDRVDADLPEAARWFLANVKPRRQTGIGVVKERQNYTCRNPECARMTLRCHVHHKQYRSKGGSDDAINLDALCPGCHLRLEHSHRIRITGAGELTTYEFPGRTVVVVGAETGK